MRLGGWLAAMLAVRAGGALAAEVPFLRLETGAHVASVREIVWTPDGREVVTCARDATVRVWGAHNGELRAVLRTPFSENVLEGQVSSAALSPDGRWLAVGVSSAGCAVRVYDLPARKLARALDAGPTNGFVVRFSPDGRLLAVAGFSPQVALFNTDTWTLMARPQLSENISALAFSPDGTELACGGWRFTVLKLPSLVERLQVPWRDATGQVYRLDWRGDGQRLLVSMSGAGGHRVVSAATGEELSRQSSAGPPCAQRDGTFFNWLTLPNGRHALQRYSADGRTALGPAREQSLGSSLALSPDEQSLAIGLPVGGVQVTTPDGERRWSRENPRQEALGFAISGAGDALAITDSQVRAHEPSAMWLAEPTGVARFDPTRAWRRASRTRGDLSLVASYDSLSLLDRAHGDQVRWTAKAGWNGEGLGDNPATILADGRVVALGHYGAGVYSTTGVRERMLVSSRVLTGMRLAASDDGRLVALSTQDGLIQVWAADDPRPEVPPLLSVYPTTSGDWIAWAEAGYYACSPGGEQFVGWQINHGYGEPAYYRAAQFRDKFYRPDIIRRLLKCGSVAKAVEEADAERRQTTDPKFVATNLASFAPPKIQITMPADGAVVTDAKITVRAVIQDPNQRKLTSALVMVNGRAPSDGRYVYVPSRGDGFAGPAELVPGENTISVTATNDAGAQAQPVSITVRYQVPDAEQTKPALYLLAIGVGDYVKPEYRLALAGKDARDFAEAYRAQQGKLFRKVGVKLLTDREATQGNLLDGLDWLTKEVTQRDYALVYLAGHGLPDAKGEFYFLPSDGDTSKLLRTGVSWQQLRGVLKNLPGKVLLILDACHSGGAAGTRATGRLDYTNALRDAATDEVGVITLASCMPSEVSFERPEWGNGAFTKALVEGLGSKADLNGDGVVSVAELDAYVAERVKELTDGRQHPTTQRPTTIRSSLPVAATR